MDHMNRNPIINLFRAAASLAVIGWPSGCAHYQPKPITASQTAVAFESRMLTNLGVRAFLETNLHHQVTPWPPASWDFTSLTLAAFYFHPDLDVARAKWGVAQAGKITAGQHPNPTVTLSPAYNATTPPPWILGLDFDIPIETAGKRRYRISQAKHLSEAARLNIAAAAWQVRSRLRQTLVDLYAASETESLLQKQETTQTDIVRLLERQLEVGNISGFDLTQARIALNTTTFALQDARKQSAEARVRVADGMGLAVHALDGIKISFAGLDQFPTALAAKEVRQRALLNRADILSALSEYAASQSALQLEIARQYPDVHLGPGYQLDQDDNKWSLGLTVTLPVLNQSQGPIAEAEARRIESAARFNALQTRVIGEIDRAVAGYQAALQKTATAESLLNDLNKRQQSVQSMFDAGITDRLALANAQFEFRVGALARLNALVKAQQSLGELEDAVQSPLTLPDSILSQTENNPRTTQEESRP